MFSKRNTGRHRKLYNGYSLFWKTSMDARVQLPGESADQCRQRIMATCREQWNLDSPDAAAFRKCWGDKARALNRANKASDHEELEGLVPLTGNHDASLVLSKTNLTPPSIHQFVPLQDSIGHGSCGLGDNDFGISERLVAAADTNTPSFVKTFSDDWKTRAGGSILETSALPNRTVRVSCQQKYGFCVQEIRNWKIYMHIFGQLRQFVSNHRRLHLRGGRNMGPSLKIQLPLLVMLPTTTSSSSASDSPFLGYVPFRWVGRL